MTPRAHPTPELIEQLYCDTLVIADEVAAEFGHIVPTDPAGSSENDEPLPVAFERVRTALLIRDASQWLRSRRTGSEVNGSKQPLGKHFKPSDLAWLCALPPNIHKVVAELEDLFTRLIELDRTYVEQLERSGSNVIYVDAWRRGMTGS